jgi:carboxyl-terminal processing protease
MRPKPAAVFVWIVTLAHTAPVGDLAPEARAGISARWGGQESQLDREARERDYEALCALVAQHYPFLEEKEIAWETLCRTHREQALRARSNAEFFEVIETLLRSLRDGQTELLDRPGAHPRVGIGVRLRVVEDRVVVDEVPPGFPADRTGILPGMEVLSIDGRPVAEVFAQRARSGRGYSTERQREYAIYRSAIFEGEPGTEVELVLRDRRGFPRTRWVRRPSSEAYRAWIERRERRGCRPRGSVEAKIMADNLGYLAVACWPEPKEALRSFEAALETLGETRGLLVDLRGNAGGPLESVEACADLFLKSPPRVLTYHPEPPGGEGARTLAEPRSRGVEPPVWSADRPVVLVVDESVDGVNHLFVHRLHEERRALTVGRATSGSTGVPRTFELPSGARVRLTVRSALPPEALFLEGRGIAADVPARPTLEGYETGADAVLARARETLLSRVRR